MHELNRNETQTDSAGRLSNKLLHLRTKHFASGRKEDRKINFLDDTTKSTLGLQYVGDRRRQFLPRQF